MQGVEKISQRRIWIIRKQEIFSATQHNQPLGCRFFGDLVEWLVVPSVGMKSGFLEAPITRASFWTTFL
jgi:hypothetical protein